MAPSRVHDTSVSWQDTRSFGAHAVGLIWLKLHCALLTTHASTLVICECTPVTAVRPDIDRCCHRIARFHFYFIAALWVEKWR